jgi:hypothetical protein
MAILKPDIHSNEYISGDFFESLCDIDTEQNKDWIKSIELEQHKVLTIFIQTHELKNIIPVVSDIDNKFIVVSHNSAGNIRYDDSGRSCDYTWKPVNNILHWFCQNMLIHEANVTPIPLGFENSCINISMNKKAFVNEISKKKNDKEFKLLICYNPITNIKERIPPYKLFINKAWATIMSGFNHQSLMREYFDAMSKHQFVLCPEGMGIDTLRIWESLYTGSIPVIKENSFVNYFKNRLPIIAVEEWGDISIEMLIDKYNEMCKTIYNWDVLKKSYWGYRIISKKYELMNMD